MGRPINWTGEMTNTALEHLENNKGDNGLYMVDRRAAVEDCEKLFAQRYPSMKVTTSQLRNKFDKLWERHRRLQVPSSSCLFREGRHALTSDFDRNNLLSNNYRVNASKSRKRSFTTAYHRQVRASTTARTMSACVEKKRESGTLHNVKQGQTDEHGLVVLVPGSSASVRPAIASSDNSSVRSMPRHDLSSLCIASPEKTKDKNLHVDALQETSDGSEKALSTSYVSFPEGAHARCQEVVNNYLLDNPDIFLPSFVLLESLKDITMREIRCAIRNLLEATKTDYDKVPQLYSTSSPDPFFDICTRVFNVARREDLSRISWTLIMQDFLRAMVAAAVYEWVFLERHDFLPSDLDEKPDVSEIFERELANLYPELFEQIRRKSKHIFVNQKLDLGIYVPRLSARLHDALSPFLVKNLPKVEHKDRTAWHNSLDKVFLAALRLKAQVMLGNREFSFTWPRSGDRFNHTTMGLDGETPGDTDGKVQLGLFPALTQELDKGTIENRPKRRTIFPAVVRLQ